MDFSTLKLPKGLTHLTLNVICDNNTTVKHIDNLCLTEVVSVRSERNDEESSEPDVRADAISDVKQDVKQDVTTSVPERNLGIVVTDIQQEKVILGLLDKLMEGKKNKDAAVIIQAALLAGAILKPSYRDFCKRYSNEIISESLFYRYVGISKKSLIREDLSPIIEQFKSLKV